MARMRRVRLDVTYGGQAVIEGVMMRGPSRMAVAVRAPSREVVIHQENILPPARRHPLWRLPLLRGMAVLVDSLQLGFKSLAFSANAAVGEEEALSQREMNLTLAVSLVVAVVFFALLPTWGVGLLRPWLGGTALNLVEGVVRLLILLGYIAAIARLPEIHRVLQYHGAEHKVINTYEAGLALTVENARVQSRFHPRCGTSFLLLVALVSILLFTLFGWPVLWQRVLLRLALLPVVAGLAYEVLRYSGRHESPWLDPVVQPGLWLQRMTTREPEDDMLEVALCALQSTLEEPVPSSA